MTGDKADTPLIKTQNLQRRFALPTHFLERHKPMLHALNGVDISIQRGAAFCVVGESGCGKTTLGRIIMGLLQPSHGEVYYEGVRIDNMSEQERRPYRRKMQMIFQNPYASLNPRMNIAKTLEEPIRFHQPNWNEKQIKDRIEEVADQVGIDMSWVSRFPHEFSGGQRQRISIARALISRPEFIVADEPISALDVSIQAQVLNLLMDVQGKNQKDNKQDAQLTYLFITHDLSVVSHFATQVAVMYMGSVVEIADRDALFTQPQHPYTQLLFKAIPKLDGEDFNFDITPGEQPDPTNPPQGCAFQSRCPLVHDKCKRLPPPLNPVSSDQQQKSQTHYAACHALDTAK